MNFSLGRQTPDRDDHCDGGYGGLSPQNPCQSGQAKHPAHHRSLLEERLRLLASWHELTALPNTAVHLVPMFPPERIPENTEE